MQINGVYSKISDFVHFDFDKYCTQTVKDIVNISVLKENGFSSSKTIKITDDVILVRLFGKKTDVITFRFERNDNDMVNFSFDLNLSRTNCELLEELITSAKYIKYEVTENYGLKY